MIVTIFCPEKDLTLNLDIQTGLTLQDFRAICSTEVDIPTNQILLIHNGKVLMGDTVTIASCDIHENDMIAIQRSPLQGRPQPQNRPAGMPRIDFSAIRVSSIDISVSFSGCGVDECQNFLTEPVFKCPHFTVYVVI